MKYKLKMVEIGKRIKENRKEMGYKYITRDLTNSRLNFF